MRATPDIGINSLELTQISERLTRAMAETRVQLEEFSEAMARMVQAFRGDEVRLEGKEHKQATELLLMFLDEEQAEQFRELGQFAFRDKKGRNWTFFRRFHYPVTVLDSQKDKYLKLCFDFDPKAPTEDLLLLAYLEVKGGRGDRLIKVGTGRRWAGNISEFSIHPNCRCVNAIEEEFAGRTRL